MCNAISSCDKHTSLCAGVKPSAMSAYLEVTDIVNKHLRYIPVPAYVFYQLS